MTHIAHAILVPLDGSPAGEHALPTAIGVARPRGVALRLAHVMPTGAGAAERQRRLAYLDDVARRVRRAADIAVETVVLEDINRATHHSEPGVVSSPRRAVAHALAAAAEQPGVDLVVLTTHGRSGFSRFWLGSVTEHLIHHAPEPLLLVRPGPGAADLGALAAFRTILVPLDGSAAAKQMLEHAVNFGRLWGARYLLLHIIDLGGPEEAMLALSPAPLDQREIDAAVDQGRAYLDRLASPLRAQGMDVITDVIVGTPLASFILGYADEQHADLIAMKTHGQSGLARLVLGSTADKVLRSAVVPVLLHRPVAS